MEYNILLETDFFNLLNAGHKNKGGNALENSYREFIKVVVDLCSTNVKQAVFALSYAETELDFHCQCPYKGLFGNHSLYVRKAIAFVLKDARACGSNISSSCAHIHFRRFPASIIRIKAICEMDWQCR